MTFRLVILTGLVAIARAGYINGGHAVGPAIGGTYVSNGGLLRGPGSGSYSSGYGYPVQVSGRYSSGVSSPAVVVRQGYGSPYPYGGRSLPVGVSGFQSISGYGGRSLSFQSPTYSYTASPILKNGGYNGAGFNSGYNNGGYNNGGYSNGYPSSNIQNYGHQPIGFTASPIPQNPHGSFNGLGNGYGY